MSMTSDLLEKHLAELEERKAHREAKVRKRTLKKQQKYWQTWKRGGFTRRREELAEFIRLCKESMKQPEFWET
jgi:hypothetical protein